MPKISLYYFVNDCFFVFFLRMLQVPALLNIIINLGAISSYEVNLTSLFKYSIEAVLQCWKRLSNDKEHFQKQFEGYLSERGTNIIRTLDIILSNNTGWVSLYEEDIHMELQVNYFSILFYQFFMSLNLHKIFCKGHLCMLCVVCFVFNLNFFF